MTRSSSNIAHPYTPLFWFSFSFILSLRLSLAQSFVGISWGLLFLIITLLGQWVQKKPLPSTHVSLLFGWMTGMIRGCLFDQPATHGSMDLWVAVTSRFEIVHHIIKEKLLLGADDIGAGYQIVLAMLLGERSMIPQDILQDFIQTGTMHILAISGLHFVLIGTIIYQAAWYLTRRRISASWITLAFIFFYVILVGERPSVFRAGIMMAVYIGADIISRRPHTMNALALAAFLILMVKPDELSHAGFQLSFLSVFGIIRVYPWMKNMSLPFFHKLELAESHSKWKRRGKNLARNTLNTFLISCAIFLVIFPISITHFNQLSFISVFANVLIVPLAGLSLTLGFTGLVFSFLFPIVSSLFFLSCGFVMNIVMFIAKGLSGWPGAYMEFTKIPGPMTLLSYYACLLGVVEYSNIKKILKKRKTKHVVIWFLVGMNIWIWTDLFWHHTVHNDHLQIHMFNVAQGESLLIETPDQKYILIDGGDRDEQFDCGERIIAPYLQRKRIRHIDALILTHPHSDHVGGLTYIVSNFDVKHIYLPDVTHTTDVYLDFLKAADEQGVPVEVLSEGDRLFLAPGLTALCLNPPEDLKGLNLNDISVVLKLDYHGTGVLLMGDAEKISENRIRRVYADNLKSDILKVAHHGSETSTQTAFLEYVRPRVAIISVGKNNVYGHPSPSVMTSLKEHGIITFRTDLDGAIDIEITKKGFVVTAQKSGRIFRGKRQ